MVTELLQQRPGINILTGIRLIKPIQNYCHEGKCYTPFEVAVLDGIKYEERSERYYIACPVCGKPVYWCSRSTEAQIIAAAFDDLAL